MSNPVYEFLHKTPLDDIATIGQIYSLNSTDTVEHAIKMLTSHNILSAPVVDTKTRQCLGMVDMLDILSWIVKVIPDHKQLHSSDLKTLETSGRAIALQEVGAILGSSGRDAYLPVFKGSPITMAVQFFAKGIHRVPVFDSNKTIIGTVSQSSVIRLLSDNLIHSALKVIGQKKVSELGLGLKPVIHLTKKAPVSLVVKTMQEQGVSAIALTENDGKLGGTFSATDLKTLANEKFPSFALNVEDFLAEHSPNSLNPIVCRGDTTLEDVCKEMIASHVHRLWVVDNDYKAVGVVSMTDIMKCICDYQYQ
jgi:CBS domain-containing protein